MAVGGLNALQYLIDDRTEERVVTKRVVRGFLCQVGASFGVPIHQFGQGYFNEKGRHGIVAVVAIDNALEQGRVTQGAFDAVGSFGGFQQAIFVAVVICVVALSDDL